ncbi:MAG: pantoate--beta-alanine ligase [Aminobacterium sp.]|jgi:pantoate--beta-alanine ligase|uniref:pantoate--beta-alanine ligase n=1 Tax=Aminobacterium sp. MB27-C1 TaxID=3070661 RepID=UPI001BD04605|nr:pantoate--beta-alanine ligase [Aminobacterium sp. MB27-C1]MDD2206273.1 pantoate--beta-alanine ligase [Aminobacterium sp.]MDD3708146.1 pantoate--beta-alanine ligase [Aminobacterium sp.]MDD4228290.1 pantoate--beta-alanine ligase [Aminobacterium sp.]MDD4551761.1 pantoate--beta-alanine ligase [Aminobacterium sp.]WMI71364.1 pantoate--beta-alanine ligase [Aminobacterium sp. MB27-C1]
MEVITRIDTMREKLISSRQVGQKIGLVPTMGFLHDGHLSLIRKAAQENDIVVVSVFVNPTQFGPQEDYEEYPRNVERDALLAEEAGATFIFHPSVEEMYPENYETYVEVTDLTKVLCGRSRPGHFRGVTTVVTKLFNIIQPDRAYFGQKDAQQAIVIQKMVRDLNQNVKICVCPIVREKDGIAMSSRNTYLTNEERMQAAVLHKSLEMAQKMIDEGERDAKTITKAIEKQICTMEKAYIDYVALVSLHNLQPLTVLSGDILIALAVKFGATRLIDNVIITV